MHNSTKVKTKWHTCVTEGFCSCLKDEGSVQGIQHGVLAVPVKGVHGTIKCNKVRITNARGYRSKTNLNSAAVLNVKHGL